MITKLLQTAVLATGLTFTSTAFAGDWTLDGENSIVSFGSIKNNEFGEAHTFSKLAGGISPEGNVAIEIDLSSIETNIDIRNERMGSMVFGSFATADLTATVDLAELSTLDVGSSKTKLIEGSVGFLGQEIPVDIDAYILRVAEDQVLVTSNQIVFLSTYDFGMDEGIDKLQEVAGLDGITRSFPVAIRLMFKETDKKS